MEEQDQKIEKELSLDVYIAYHVPRSKQGNMRHQREYHNAHVSLMVDPTVQGVPDGLTRSMVEVLRQKIAKEHDVDMIHVYIENIMLLALEHAPMVKVPDGDNED